MNDKKLEEIERELCDDFGHPMAGDPDYEMWTYAMRLLHEVYQLRSEVNETRQLAELPPKYTEVTK